MMRQALKDRMLLAKKLTFMMQQGILSIMKVMKLRKVYIEAFHKLAPRRRLLHDVYQNTNGASGSRLDVRVLRERYTGAVLIIASHGDHYHFILDCAYSNSSCRCAILTNLCKQEDVTLDELFLPSTSQSVTGSISQSISRSESGKWITWSSPGERGYRVVKLDVYDFNEISGIDKQQWWTKANYRSTFITSSPVDPKEMAVQKLLSMAAEDLAKVKGAEKSEKSIKSYFTSKTFPHRQ